MMDHNKYFGTIENSVTTESFNISLTNHISESKISKHAHDKPYLCLLVSGNYDEKSNTKNLISSGEVIYRTAGYEHSNLFHDVDSLCLNIEINNPRHLMNLNDFALPVSESKQKGSIEVYKVLYALKKETSADLLDIYCYESMISYINTSNRIGKLFWVKQIKERINDDPISPLSLEKLSVDFGLHPNYIVRKFKEVTGFKLSEYLTKIRLEYSINKLIISDDKITKIALDAGFYDQSHYIRNFKNHVTTTPLNFKKTIKS
jgi:AraC family transcriptional regulator